MILFYEDWEKYPEAFPDLSTRNAHFIRLAGLYKSMGIKNHSFILALHDSDLVGVDPHDPNLTEEQMIKISLECEVNFWYYLREVAKAPAESGITNNPIKANRGNIALFWLFFNHITTILIQIRQTGKSFNSDVLMVYLLNIKCSNTYINLLTKDDTLRSRNIERLKNIIKTLPPYLQMLNNKDTSNTEEISIKLLGNRYRGHVPQKSRKMATNVGRGLTSAIFHCDEGPFSPNIHLTLPSALMAGNAARDEAKLNNEPYGTIITTTTGNIDEPEGRYIYNLTMDSAQWTEKFFDVKNIDELESIIRLTSPSKSNLRVDCTFNHRQLGYSDEWLARKLEESLSKGDAAAQDLFNKWVSGNSESPLNKDIIEIISNSENGDYHTEIQSNLYTIRWHIDKNQIENYKRNKVLIMALDTSDAIGKDDIAIIIRDNETGEVVAAGNYNETNLFSFVEWLLEWFLMCPRLILIPERRSSAIVMLDFLIIKLLEHNIDPFKRIFNWVVNDKESKPERFNEINTPMNRRDMSVYTRHKKEFGFATSGSGRTSRDMLYRDVLLSATTHTGDTVRDKKLINQITKLVVRNGRIDHIEGSNDDLCITWLLSYWFLTKARNLSFYGIDPRLVLIRIKENIVNMNPEAQYENRRQIELNEEVSRIIESLRNESDPNIARMREHRLKTLVKELETTTNKVYNIDALLEDIKIKRNIRNLNNIYS